MIEAMGLGPGDSLLDCTLGMASDAVVASLVVGEEGRIVGLESVPALAALVACGLKTYAKRPELAAAMRRIQVERAVAGDYLRECPAASYDVVYFDPMFDRPVEESAGIRPLREVADPSPLTLEDLLQARRTARRRVVVKERRDGPLTRQGVFDRVVGARRSRVVYGVLEAVR